jgi:hypothetical protein
MMDWQDRIVIRASAIAAAVLFLMMFTGVIR